MASLPYLRFDRVAHMPRPRLLAAALAVAGVAAVAVAAVPTGAPAASTARVAEPRLAPAPETQFAVPTAAAVEIYATMGPSDTFKDVLARSGVAKADAAAAAELVKTAEPAGLAKGTEIALLLGATSGKDSRRLERVRFQPGPASKILIGRTVSGELRLAREALAVDATPHRFRGRAGSDLFWSLRAAGVPASAAREYLDVLATKVILQSVKPADRFDLIVDSLRVANGEARLGSPIYAGLRTQAGRQLNLVRWTLDGQSGWVDLAKPEQRAEAFERPVRGAVTSAFGYRVHPILRFGRFHQGVDIGAASGTPVFAAADGVVVGAGWNGGHGRQVRVAHSDGVLTSYSHLSQILAQPGTRVIRGQLVGLVGSSGFSTGAHLHFEVRRHGRPVDPLRFRPAASEPLQASEIAALRARLSQLQSI
jgi:murein DD-endopeptidase MepM/ murein hydrolase activator NlpD